jgi:1-deoxy-D-xylulose-5-phosphate synthase
VITDVALHRLPVVFVIDRAGVTGPDGSSHHGIFDLSYLRAVPNLAIASPADESELSGLLETALAMDGPVAIRYPRSGARTMPEMPGKPIPLGRWDEVRRGTDAAIVAIGRMVGAAQEAAELLAADGIDIGVINARWLKPIDPRLVDEWGKRYPLLLTAEDGVASGGLGAAVLEALAPSGSAGKVRVAALPDSFLPHGKGSDILAQHGLSGAGLADRIRAEVGQRARPRAAKAAG